MFLFQHNIDAYTQAVWMLRKTGKAAIVHPTGTGKSFIAFKLCEDHPRQKILWLSPSDNIYNIQKENWRKAGGTEPANTTFLTYAKLMVSSDDDIKNLRPDYIILDEFHRCGAKCWGKGVGRVLKAYKKTPVLGLSATAIRFLDNQRNMADELFSGNVASEMTLGEAIVRGILNQPKYILSAYQYQSTIKSYEKKIEKTHNEAIRITAKKELNALRKALDMADDLDIVFDRHMTERHGKYLVFCADTKHLYEMIKKVPEWFEKIDPEPHIYKVYTHGEDSCNELPSFAEDVSDHLKLLFCVDMMNEGVHISDVSGVILLRPTASPTIYKQQIGRAFSAGSKHEPVVFDIVMNIDNLCSVGAIDEEMRDAVRSFKGRSERGAIVQDHFRVTDELKDSRSVFQKLEKLLDYSWDQMYEHAEEYYGQHGDLDVLRSYVTEDGFRLGDWLATQRRVRRGISRGILSKEQIEKLDAIGMRWEDRSVTSWDKNYAAAKGYFEEHGNLLVPARMSYQGVELGHWLVNLRQEKKGIIPTTRLTEERISDLESIGMVWDAAENRWEENYKLLEAYKAEHGSVNVPYDYTTPSGFRLGMWLTRMIEAHNGTKEKHTVTEQQFEKLEQLGVCWDGRREYSWQDYYREAEQYYKKNGNLDMPSDFVSRSGRKLGKWVRRQKKTDLSEEQRRLLTEIDMKWEQTDESWDNKMALVKEYYKEHGNLDLPKYVYGVKLNYWFQYQMSRWRGEPVGKRKKVKPLSAYQIQELKSVLPNN